MEVNQTYGKNAGVRTVYAPSTSGSLAYAIEPAYRSTRLASAEPLRKAVPDNAPAAPRRKPTAPQKPAAPKIKKERVPLSLSFRENHIGTKLFLVMCVGIIAAMGILMVFNFKAVSDTQCEINEASDAIEEMNRMLREADMGCDLSFNINAARLAAEKADMIKIPSPGAGRR